MAHAQKPDFVFRRNGRVHLNRWGRQFSRLLAAVHISLQGLYCSYKPVFCSHVTLTGYPLHCCFPFTSPPVRHRVPSHFNWILLPASYVTSLYSRVHNGAPVFPFTLPSCLCKIPSNIILPSTYNFFKIIPPSGGHITTKMFYEFYLCNTHLSARKIRSYLI